LCDLCGRRPERESAGAATTATSKRVVETQ
jgi:hypothetical protein